MSKLVAEQECSKSGGSLVNYKEIQDKPSASTYLDQLKNGGSAWIDGYAEFSPILYWQGCYSITDSRYIYIYTFKIEDRSLFLCSKECLRHDASISYVGVKDTTCYCIDSHPAFLPYREIVNSSLCNISCSKNAIDSCGGDLHMDLYGTEFVVDIVWGQTEPANGQCVYYKLNTSTVEAYTASCHTRYIDGFVCKEVEGSALDTSSCNSSINSGVQYCFKAEPSTGHEAHELCKDINGRLTFHRSFTKTVGLIDHMYWTGFFRSFGLLDNVTSNAVCVAATKVNNIIYLEPDDCTVKKYFLCQYMYIELLSSMADNSFVSYQQPREASRRTSSQAPRLTKSKKNSSSQVPRNTKSKQNLISQPLQITKSKQSPGSQVPGITKFKQNSSSQTPRIAKSEQPSSICSCSNIGYMSLAVSVVAFAVAAGVIILLYKFKTLIMSAVLRHVDSLHRADSLYHHPVRRNDQNYSPVSSFRHYAVPDLENCSTDTHSKHLTKQIPLAESSFVEEDLHTVKRHHVYEGLSDDRKHTTYEDLSQSNDSKQ